MRKLEYEIQNLTRASIAEMTARLEKAGYTVTQSRGVRVGYHDIHIGGEYVGRFTFNYYGRALGASYRMRPTNTPYLLEAFRLADTHRVNARRYGYLSAFVKAVQTHCPASTDAEKKLTELRAALKERRATRDRFTQCAEECKTEIKEILFNWHMKGQNLLSTTTAKRLTAQTEQYKGYTDDVKDVGNTLVTIRAEIEDLTK